MPVGFAVEVRCKYCRMFLTRAAVDPLVPVLLDLCCRSNTCRGRQSIYRVFDGHAVHLTTLTDEEERAMVGAAAEARDRIASVSRR